MYLVLSLKPGATHSKHGISGSFVPCLIGRCHIVESKRKKDSTSLKYSGCTPSSILDRLASCPGALSEKNSVFRKNSDKTPPRKRSPSLNWMREVVKSELDWTSRAARIFRQADLLLSSK